MTKVIMNGCNGKMGQTITEICKADADIKIVAGIDLYDGIDNDYPVFSSIDKCDVDADVVIDFSNAKAVDGVLDYCVDKQVPVVLCTTGLSDEQLAKVEECYKKVAVLKSANMSLGINTLMALLKKAAQVFAPAGFDMEIVEKHHNLKLDAPSGTALALADSINEAMDNEYHYVYDRSQRREKRDPKEIGISAVRGGSIVGEHEVINDVSDAMKGMLAPKVREVALGEAQVRQVYKISSVGTVAGCRVTDGKITRDAQLRLVRDGIVICEDSIASLKRFKDDAKEVAEGYECGITLAKFQDIKEGDVFECFKMEEYRD